jgi:L-lactate dehydrogenase complex protein LldG
MEQQITSKEKILKKVRAGLINKSKSSFHNIDLESNVFARPQGETYSEMFVKGFTEAGGQFVYCDNRFDCIDKLIDFLEQRKLKFVFCREEGLQDLLTDSGITFYSKNDTIEKIQVSITSCESMLAATGSIMVSSNQQARVMSIWPPVHIVIAYRSQVVLDMKESFQVLRNKYGRNIPSLISYITGISCTSDFPAEVEGQLPEVVMGAQGPLELILFLIDDRKQD